MSKIFLLSGVIMALFGPAALLSNLEMMWEICSFFCPEDGNADEKLSKNIPLLRTGLEKDRVRCRKSRRQNQHCLRARLHSFACSRDHSSHKIPTTRGAKRRLLIPTDVFSENMHTGAQGHVDIVVGTQHAAVDVRDHLGGGGCLDKGREGGT